MPRVAILGATSQLGHDLISRALERGFSVHALARDPGRIVRSNEQLTVFQGDAETGEGLKELLAGCNYVVTALGSVRPVLEQCMRTLVPMLENRKMVKRFVMLSRLGAGDSLPQSRLVSGMLRSMLPVILMPLFKDINLAEDVVRKSTLPYTIFRATRLTDDGSAEVVVVGPNDPPPHRVRRTALANFVIDGLEDPSHPEWLRHELTVGSK